MTLYNGNWIDGQGDPITGRTPASIVVDGNGGTLTRGQQGDLAHHFKLFCDQVSGSVFPAGLHIRHGELSDGSRYVMRSINNCQSVQVKVTGGEKKELYHGIGIAFEGVDGTTVPPWERPTSTTNPTPQPQPVVLIPDNVGNWRVKRVKKLVGGTNIWVNKARTQWISTLYGYYSPTVDMVKGGGLAKPYEPWMKGDAGRISQYYQGTGYSFDKGRYVMALNETLGLTPGLIQTQVFYAAGKMAYIECTDTTTLTLHTSNRKDVKGLEVKPASSLSSGDYLESGFTATVSPPAGYTINMSFTHPTVHPDGKRAIVMLAPTGSSYPPAYGKIGLNIPAGSGMTPSVSMALASMSTPADTSAPLTTISTCTGLITLSPTVATVATEPYPTTCSPTGDHMPTGPYLTTTEQPGVIGVSSQAHYHRKSGGSGRSSFPAMAYYALNGDLVETYQYSEATYGHEWVADQTYSGSATYVSGVSTLGYLETPGSGTSSATMTFSDYSNSETYIHTPKSPVKGDKITYAVSMTGTATQTGNATESVTIDYNMVNNHDIYGTLFHDHINDIVVRVADIRRASAAGTFTGSLTGLALSSPTADISRTITLEVVRAGVVEKSIPIECPNSKTTATVRLSNNGNLFGLFPLVGNSGNLSTTVTYNPITTTYHPVTYAGECRADNGVFTGRTYGPSTAEFTVNESAWSGSPITDPQPGLSVAAVGVMSLFETHVARDPRTLASVVHVLFKKDDWVPGATRQSWFFAIDSKKTKSLNEILNAATTPTNAIDLDLPLRPWAEASLHSLVSI